MTTTVTVDVHNEGGVEIIQRRLRDDGTFLADTSVVYKKGEKAVVHIYDNWFIVSIKELKGA